VNGTPIRPEVTPDSQSFWQGCREGVLRLLRCDGCEGFVHPPVPVCPVCHGRDLHHEDVDPSGVIYSLTVNHQPLRPGLPVPYAVALVELTGAPPVRLTARVLTEAPESVAIGQPVRFRFERVDDTFSVPVVEPTGPPEEHHHASLGEVSFSAGRMDRKVESDAVITGVGRSAVGRRLLRSDLDLTVEAAAAAIADAGLVPGDIDGIATYPGGGVGPPGYSGPQSDDVAAALGLELSWHRGGAEGAGQLQPVIDAVLAVAGGLCQNALVYRTTTESTIATWMKQGRVPPPEAAPASGFTEWLLPFDSVTPANWLAPYAARHMHQFGTTRRQLGMVAVTARRHAALHPEAVFTDPITLDDHLGARPISTPLGLLDCDVPVDGSVAVIISAVQAAVDQSRAIRFEALGSGLGFPPSWHQWPDLTTMGANGAAATMWARTDLGPRDVDVAQLYDGFTFLALFWLEALGFCAHGDSGPFVESGEHISLGGDLPLNTGGGQLSGGRLHGWGLLEEAVVQLRGEAGDRQVDGAEVGVVSTGGGPIAGCLLLTR